MSSPVQNHRNIAVEHPVQIVSGERSFYVNLDPNRPDYVTTDGVEVWMERKRQKVRFLDADGNQHGPTQPNLVPAILYARAHGWKSATDPEWWNEECASDESPVSSGDLPGDLGIPSVDELPRPVLDPKRRDSLADIDTITKPRSPAPCMAVVGHATVDIEKQIHERVWSGQDASEVHCGKLATVDVGFHACTQHGAVAEAERVQNEVFRETGTWLPSESRPVVPRSLVFLRQRRVEERA